MRKTPSLGVVYYYRDDAGASHGPLTQAELAQAVGDGRVQPTTLVWTPGVVGWQTYEALFPSEQAPPQAGAPPPLTKQSSPMGFASSALPGNRPKRRLLPWVVGIVVLLLLASVGAILSHQGRTSPADNAEERASVLNATRDLWAKAETQFAAGEIGAGYQTTLRADRRFLPLLKYGINVPVSGNTGETLGQLKESWMKRLGSALDQGMPEAVRRLEQAEESMALPAQCKQLGLPQLADYVARHDSEINTARVNAAAHWVRILVPASPAFRTVFEQAFRERFQVPPPAKLVFEPPVSNAENAATWRTIVIELSVSDFEYRSSSGTSKRPTLSLPCEARAIFVVVAGPGPRTNWDTLPEVTAKISTPQSIRVERDDSGKIMNAAELPSPATYESRLSVQMRAELLKSLPEFKEQN